MNKIRISKTDAAFRQINAAIRMYFDGEDVVAIHSLAAAAHRIIRDICEDHGDIESYFRFTDWIVDGHEREFWMAFNRSANFFKHADKDPNDIHEFDPRETEFVILFATKWYRDLGLSMSPEMSAFAGWITICQPNLVTPAAREALYAAGYKDQFDETSRLMHTLPPKDRLKIGSFILQQQKARHASNGDL